MVHRRRRKLQQDFFAKDLHSGDKFLTTVQGEAASAAGLQARSGRLTLQSIQDIYAHHARLVWPAILPMSKVATAPKCRSRRTAWLLLSTLLVVAASHAAWPLPKDHSDQAQPVMLRIEAPVEDVLKAVQEVTQDQIIHGTYSYEKERILYGAHSASSSKAFGAWHGDGQVLYKVADRVLAPRFFKDTGDIGTITVRYIVQQAGPTAATLQIDAVFVDARNSRHPSLGAVEGSEYTAIQQRLKTIQASKNQPQENVTRYTASPSAASAAPGESRVTMASSDALGAESNVKELQRRVDSLRHEVELRVRDSGAPLKAAPFRSSATLETLPAQTELLIVVLTPYWYGVETEDGHHGWVHRSQLEPLP
jgi:hypothetical protein